MRPDFFKFFLSLSHPAKKRRDTFFNKRAPQGLPDGIFSSFSPFWHVKESLGM
jgi:hypothetical protein